MQGSNLPGSKKDAIAIRGLSRFQNAGLLVLVDEMEQILSDID